MYSMDQLAPADAIAESKDKTRTMGRITLVTISDSREDPTSSYKVEFEKPTTQARKQIWKSMLKDLNDDQAAELASRYDFSGGQIQNISRKQVINAIFSGKEDIDYEQIKIDCQNETISRNNGRRIGF